MRGALHLALALTSLAPLAACSTADQARLQTGLQDAAEVCSVLTATGPVLVALADANGVPVPATGKAATAVQADCAAVQAVVANLPAGQAPPATVTLPPKPS